MAYLGTHGGRDSLDVSPNGGQVELGVLHYDRLIGDGSVLKLPQLANIHHRWLQEGLELLTTHGPVCVFLVGSKGQGVEVN